MDIVMGIIAVAQAILIIITSAIVLSNHHRHMSFHKSMEAIYGYEAEIHQKDSLSKNSNQLSFLNDIMTAKNEMVGLESQIMKSNDYFTVILSLITLCATLAVVIPYIVGKSVSKNYIDEKVDLAIKQNDKQIEKVRDRIDDVFIDIKQSRQNAEDAYKESREKMEKQYEQSMKAMSWAEAHLSRMTAYLLAFKNGNKKTEKNEHSWAIGWASKALSRYINLYESSERHFNIDSFIQYCLDIIDYSSKDLKLFNLEEKDTSDAKGKVLRAFIDLYDAVRFSETKGIEVFDRNYESIVIPSLKVLYNKSVEFNGGQVVIKALVAKSKHRNSLAKEVYMSDAINWISTNIGKKDQE